MVQRGRHDVPVIGEVVALLPKRVRVTLGHAHGYRTVLRAAKNLTLAKKGRGLF
jgi:hypothetical protein